MFITEKATDYIFEEKECKVNLQQKYETLMCLGNGYIGMRSAFCEEYSGQNRLTLIAGLYDHQPNEVEELFPLPDATRLTIAVNGKNIGPLHDGSENYERSLNVKNGLMTYSFDSKCEDDGIDVSVTQRRFVSMKQIHFVAFETILTSKNDAQIIVKAAINARQTLDGTQHIFEEEREVLENDVMWYGGRAAVNGTKFRVSNQMQIFVDGRALESHQQYATSRRYVETKAVFNVKKGEEVRIIRYALYYTQNDPEWGDKSAELMQEYMLKELQELSLKGFEGHLAESAESWTKRWNRCDIIIDGDNSTDTLKTRLGMYHSMIMCPTHDDRVSIAAKGLTGPGYAGHVFWDCEIFNLPFFVYTDPDSAKKLCTYRYHTLNGARRKAKEYGFKGAMYPWESAGMHGEEQCPKKGNYNQCNVLRDIICGDIEHHVVCDVAYGAYNYAKTTGDVEFMEKYGLEILFETANFWQSRLDYIAEKDRYEICDVIGPDEYKEHVDNNAYTNYMAAWNMKTAVEEAEKIKTKNPELFSKFDSQIGLSDIVKHIKEKLPKLYLPVPNEDGLVPQDDTYLTLPQIDVAKFKNSGINRYIWRFYTLEQMSKHMVSKQADFMQLVALMPDLFPKDIIKKNFTFYEDKCLHDSSLSLSAYAIVAARAINAETALKFFRGALDTDFGENASNSNAGIHAANCGGLWQCIAFGFVGLQTDGDVLKIAPMLPQNWNKISFNLFWRDAELSFCIDHNNVSICSANGKQTVVIIGGKTVSVGMERINLQYA